MKLLKDLSDFEASVFLKYKKTCGILKKMEQSHSCTKAEYNHLAKLLKQIKGCMDTNNYVEAYHFAKEFEGQLDTSIESLW